ncbi:hypothetical protein NL676_034027 [Syzygium grande]|nr:hypothetical protein NL676_034027 [Syzygium grande]
MAGWSSDKGGGTAATRSDADWREEARGPIGLADSSRSMKPSSITKPLLIPFLLAFLLLTMQANLSCAAGGTATHDRPPDTHSPTTSPLAHPMTVRSHLSRVYVGTAAHYSPPYTPTACYGKDPAQFPSNNIFAAAGEEIWNNGIVCGRYFLVRCISASVSGTCIPNQNIQVRIVDRALSSPSRPSRNGATIVLSMMAFSKIAKSSAVAINVEYQQYVLLLT